MISSLKAQPTLVFMDSEEKPIEKQKEKIEEVDIADFMDYVWMEKPFFGESTKRVKLDNKENKNKENTAIKDIEPSNAQVMATGSSHRI